MKKKKIGIVAASVCLLVLLAAGLFLMHIIAKDGNVLSQSHDTATAEDSYHENPENPTESAEIDSASDLQGETDTSWTETGDTSTTDFSSQPALDSGDNSVSAPSSTTSSENILAPIPGQTNPGGQTVPSEQNDEPAPSLDPDPSPADPPEDVSEWSRSY